MLTMEQISKFAMSLREKQGDRFAVGAQYGAIWANEQNAAEIAELLGIFESIYDSEMAHIFKQGYPRLPESMVSIIGQILEKYGKK